MGVRFIVYIWSSVGAHIHKTISLIVVNSVNRAVDWNHFKVRTKSVSLGVRVGEDSGLENSVVRQLNTGN
jgi:hypothetical protein